MKKKLTHLRKDNPVTFFSQMDNLTHYRFEQKVRNAFAPLIFRRVFCVTTRDEDLMSVMKYTCCGPLPFTDPSATPSKQEHDQYYEYMYSNFEVTTSKFALRPNDPVHGREIILYPYKYAEMNIANGTFEFERKKRFVPPRESDLVCFTIDTDSPKLKVKNWFVCSEQFYRMWSILMTENYPRSNDMHFLFKGSKLCTNSYRKWLLGTSKITFEEANKRYYRLRTEETSIKWVHLYACVVLMFKFRQLPTQENVPHIYTPEGEIHENDIGKWDVPRKFIDRVLGFEDRVDKSTPTYKASRKSVPRVRHVENTLNSCKKVKCCPVVFY